MVEVNMDVTKARLSLLGIICLLTLAAASLWIVKAAPSSVVPYPSCDVLPSSKILKGYWIDWYDGYQTVSADRSFVKDWYWITDWSARSSEEQQNFLSGTNIYLFIDGKPAQLKVDLCYDKDGDNHPGGVTHGADVLYKIFYLQFSLRQYMGEHNFVVIFFWAGYLDTETTPNPSEFTVCFNC
jgi:hypothetical protein